VRVAVEEIVGAPVVEAVSQVGGFSPGTADRVRTSDGRRAFVKAVGTALNPQSPAMHRREAMVTAALPAEAPVPALLGCVDDGDWTALVLQDIPGRHPATPWRTDELTRVLATLADLAARLTPAPLTEVPSAVEALAHDFAGWQRITADPPPGLDPQVARRLDRWREAAEFGLAALAGNTLAHTDVRADNLLIGEDGTVYLVDWPHACLVPVWFDRLMLLANVRLYGGHDTDCLLSNLATDTGTPVQVLRSVLAGFVGFFTDAARLPDLPGLPTLRQFQRAHADAIISWLQTTALISD
jgi:Ser/Thr protein kinase RdoA (MazF antagonist)